MNVREVCSLLAVVGAGMFTGIHHLYVSALGPGLWGLPPAMRARAAGSFHRFADPPRALAATVMLLALAGLAWSDRPGTSSLLALGLALGAVFAALSARPAEEGLIRLFYEGAGAEEDREFIALQQRWDSRQRLCLTLSLAVLAFTTAAVLG